MELAEGVVEFGYEGGGEGIERLGAVKSYYTGVSVMGFPDKLERGKGLARS